MPLLTKRSVLAAKIEATVGTAQALVAADAAMNVFDLRLSTNVDFTERQSQGGFSPMRGTLGPYSAQVTFRVEFRLDASPPLEFATLLPACGFLNTAGVFSPASLSPGVTGGPKTVTLGFYNDGVFRRLRGAMGNVVFIFPSGRVAVAEFTFNGIMVLDGSGNWLSDVAILAPAYPTGTPVRFTGADLSLGAWEPCFQELRIDMGNDVQPRPCANGDRSGLISYIITGRRITTTIDPETSLVAAANPHGAWINTTEQELDFTLTAESASDPDFGAEINFNAPKHQITGIGIGDRNGIMTDEITGQLNKESAAGDDELIITFTAAP